MLKLLEDREKYFARLINIIYFFLNILLGIERNFYLLLYYALLFTRLIRDYFIYFFFMKIY